MFAPVHSGFADVHSELLLHERQSLIRKRLAERGRVIAADLAQEFAISEDTIRRDLREMAAAGLLKRVYGGALPIESAEDNPLINRVATQPERKTALGRATVPLLAPGATVFIDAGSTNLAVAQAIPASLSLTVITNAPLVAAALMEKAGVDVVLIGGRLDQKSGAVLGSKAMQDVSGFRPDLCVLGSCGLDVQHGVTASFFEEAEFKRHVALRSNAVVAAVTNEKLGVPAPFAVIPLENCTDVIIEHDANVAFAEEIAGRGISVTRARKQ